MISFAEKIKTELDANDQVKQELKISLAHLVFKTYLKHSKTAGDKCKTILESMMPLRFELLELKEICSQYLSIIELP